MHRCREAAHPLPRGCPPRPGVPRCAAALLLLLLLPNGLATVAELLEVGLAVLLVVVVLLQAGEKVLELHLAWLGTSRRRLSVLLLLIILLIVLLWLLLLATATEHGAGNAMANHGASHRACGAPAWLRFHAETAHIVQEREAGARFRKSGLALPAPASRIIHG